MITTFIVQTILGALLIPIFILISVPLHELGHYIFLVLAGGRTDNVKIEFLNFSWRNFELSAKLSSSIFGFEFPWRFRKHRKLIAFLFGLSGGIGSTLLMFLLILLPLWFAGYLYLFIAIPIILNMMFESVYSIYEAFESLNPDQLRCIVFSKEYK